VSEVPFYFTVGGEKYEKYITTSHRDVDERSSRCQLVSEPRGS